MYRHLTTFLICSFAVLATPLSFADCQSEALEKAANGSHRAEGHSARNDSRNPVETLKFFGLNPNMTVVEVSPGGGGWYTEILAPFLRDKGMLYLGSYDPDSTSDYYRGNAIKFNEKLAAHPKAYDKAVIGIFDPAGKMETAPSGSADMVLTFRNTHNWYRSGQAETSFAAMYEFLKPGGVLGVVQHRGKDGETYDGKAGYMTEAQVVALAEGAGFVLIDKSEINANPRDTKNHPGGVWSLPPVLRLKDDEQHLKESMMAIGESDRMTLKFVRPVKLPEENT